MEVRLHENRKQKCLGSVFYPSGLLRGMGSPRHQFLFLHLEASSHLYIPNHIGGVSVTRSQLFSSNDNQYQESVTNLVASNLLVSRVLRFRSVHHH